jgi:hypothetical protein
VQGLRQVDEASEGITGRHGEFGGIGFNRNHSMRSERCYFAVKGKRCCGKREGLATFCFKHRTVFAGLDNPRLLEQAAECMRNTLYVNHEKKLSCTLDMELWGNFNNHLNELSARGYSPREAMAAVGSIAQEKGLLDDLYQEMGLDPKWTRFEKIVAGIHMLSAEGAEVKFDDEIEGRRTGRRRQIDVSIRFKQTYYDYLAVIECKDYGTKVSIEKVETFRTKMEDVGAMKGIMVSPKGFQEGAVRTAAAYNIELFTLTEVKSDWTKTIKADVINLPFPTNIELDHPTGPELHVEPHRVKFSDVIFHKNATNPPIPLSQILADVCKWAVRTELAMPSIVDISFESPLLIQFPGVTFFTPVYGIRVTLERSKLALGREIDMPPKSVKYVYSDIAKVRVHEIRAEDLPPVV